jgi:hypothetical protein
MTRLAEFGEAGITATTVSRMAQAGEVVRLARGLYQLPDAALDPQQSLAEAARLVPKGVICLASALAVHGLTDQMPPKVWIAIGRKDWRPRVTYPPIRVARFPDDLLSSWRRTKEDRRHPRACFRRGQDSGRPVPLPSHVGDAIAIDQASLVRAIT